MAFVERVEGSGDHHGVRDGHVRPRVVRRPLGAVHVPRPGGQAVRRVQAKERMRREVSMGQRRAGLRVGPVRHEEHEVRLALEQPLHRSPAGGDEYRPADVAVLAQLPLEVVQPARPERPPRAARRAASVGRRLLHRVLEEPDGQAAHQLVLLGPRAPPLGEVEGVHGLRGVCARGHEGPVLAALGPRGGDRCDTANANGARRHAADHLVGGERGPAGLELRRAAVRGLGEGHGRVRRAVALRGRPPEDGIHRAARVGHGELQQHGGRAGLREQALRQVPSRARGVHDELGRALHGVQAPHDGAVAVAVGARRTAPDGCQAQRATPRSGQQAGPHPRAEDSRVHVAHAR
mmetsp:Transcript_3079/g.10124  ORF Transcript_3079/g.10124 Transcript_3079/m.10124 type:complete len:349 (-) Transcript_3079:85-1131(-)